jgi:hypothetical protein
MGVATNYVLHGIQTPSAFVSQISNGRVSSGVQQLVSYAAGWHQPLFAGNLAQKPEITFDSMDIATILGSSVTVQDLSAGNTDLYFRKATSQGSRTADATGVHYRLRAAMGLYVPGSIRAGSQSAASLSGRILCIYDGTNAPLVPAGSVALAGTQVCTNHFTSGPVWLNGAQITGVQDLSIDFGINVRQLSGDGDIYDTFACVGTQSPVVTMRILGTPSGGWQFGLNGTALTSASFYLRAINQTGRVANATTSHVKFAATAGYITCEESGGGDNGEAVTTIKCQLTAADTSTAIMTVSTAIAITS